MARYGLRDAAVSGCLCAAHPRKDRAEPRGSHLPAYRAWSGIQIRGAAVKRRVFIKLLAAFVVLIAVAMLVLDVAVRRAWEASLRAEITNSLEQKVKLFADDARRTPANEY